MQRSLKGSRGQTGTRNLAEILLKRKNDFTEHLKKENVNTYEDDKISKYWQVFLLETKNYEFRRKNLVV